MITLLSGDNDFEIEHEMHQHIEGFDGTAERIEGETLELSDLPDLLLGMSLFSANRMIVIKRLSENRTVWTELADYIARISDETHVILVETGLDKRTKTYKALQKHGETKEYRLWGERDIVTAERWATAEAKRLGITIDHDAIRSVVGRSLLAGEKGAVIDQWRLVSSLQKLAVLGTVRASDVEAYIEETPIESVFGLLETALKADKARVSLMVSRLEPTEDPFRLFGLLGGQVFWLAVLAAASKPSADVAKQFGVHPFVLSKLAPYAKLLGQSGAGRVAAFFAEADSAMKTSGGEPWLLIERALLKTAASASKTKRSA